MKKIGQKLSFFTKILLVVGLLISNLSSLSVVFAYEGEIAEDLIVELVDGALEINYTEILAEGVEAVDVKVYENYTYLDDSSEEEVLSVYSLTGEQLLAAAEGKLELTYDSIFASEEEVAETEVVEVGEEVVRNFELFDGTYSARVEIVDVTVYPEETVDETEIQVAEERTGVSGTILAEGTYEEIMAHDSGLNIKLFDSTGNERTLKDGNYLVSVNDSKVTVVAQILSGGLNPTDVFVYNGEEFMASELLQYEFSSSKDFMGHLFGEYELPVEVRVSLVDSDEELVYADSVNVLYESYEMNATVLNDFAVSSGYGDAYLFYSDTADGELYVLSDIDGATEQETVVTRTMLDLYNMLNIALGIEDENTESFITYTLFKNGVNVLESYDASAGVSLEDYLATLLLDETVEVVLSNDGLTISYKVVIAGDLNNDNVITSDDVLELINQVVGESEVTDLEKSDVYGFDEEVNSLDVLYLNQVVKTKVWDAEITETEVSLDASLDVKLNEEALSEENYLVSGDEFTVDYVLSLSDYEVNGISGMLNYDKTLFELVSVEVSNEWLGNNKDGKFLYLRDESLTGPELEDNESEIEDTESSGEAGDEAVLLVAEDLEEDNSLEHVVLTATFRALKATDEESNNVITLEEIELFNSNEDGVVYYVLDQNEVSTNTIPVTASDDNTLQYLEVAGVKVALEDGVYEYEITVPNDVTLVDLKYILGNVAANATSSEPVELVEGANTIIVTVTSESGIKQDYTVIVIREEAEEETTTEVNYSNNYNDKKEEENKKEDVVVTEPTEEEEVVEEEKSNLSRIVIIILILLVIAGLVYLIFKDEDDGETKKANKEVNRLKKESIEPEVVKTTDKKTGKKPSNNNKNNSSKNKKKER